MPNFNTALSGLSANGTAIDVTGNNLANMNTSGFKTSTTSFRDLVGDSMAGASAANGQGVAKPQAVRRFTQGSIQGTQGSMDAAISGGGFFLLKNAQGQSVLTRAGNFSVDKSGNLKTLSGESVQGWNAAAGVLSTAGATSNIVLPPLGARTPLATTRASITANLNAAAETGAASTFTTPIEIVDSLGGTHILTVTFAKTGPNAWSYDVTIPGADTGGTAPTSAGTGTLTFDDKGVLTAPAAPGDLPVAISGLANGAAAIAMNIGLLGPNGQPTLTQFVQASATSAVEQDGAAAAEIVGLSMHDGGTVMAEYSNGRQGAVAQLAMAVLRNPESLAPVGNNLFRPTEESSALAIGVAGTGGRGSITGQALEGSTVDIAREFTNLIVYQRGYQANSKVITAMDEITQSVINIVR